MTYKNFYQIILFLFSIALLICVSSFIKGIEYENLQSEKLLRLSTLSTKIFKYLYSSEKSYNFDTLLSCKKRIDILECYILNPKQFLEDQIECIKYNILTQLNFIDKGYKKELQDLIDKSKQFKISKQFSKNQDKIELKSFMAKLKDAYLNDIIYQTTLDDGISIDYQYFINLLKDVISTYKNIKKNNLTSFFDENLRNLININNSKVEISKQYLRNKEQGKIQQQFESTLINNLIFKLKENNDYDINADNIIRELYQEKFDSNVIDVRNIYGLIEEKEGVQIKNYTIDQNENTSSLYFNNILIKMHIRQVGDKLIENIGKKIQRKHEDLTAENIPQSIKLIKDWKRMSIIFHSEKEIFLFIQSKKNLFGNDFKKELQFNKQKILIRIYEIKNGFQNIKSDYESGDQRDVKIIQEVNVIDLDMAFFIECQLNLENLIIYKKVDHILQDFERAKDEFQIVKSEKDRQEWMEGNNRLILQLLRTILIIISISSIGISFVQIINDLNLRLKTIWHANLKIQVKFIEGNYPNNICQSIDNEFVNCVGYTNISTYIQNQNKEKFQKLYSNGKSLIGINSDQKFIKYYLNDQNDFNIDENIQEIKQNNNIICQSNDKNISCIHRKVQPNIISVFYQNTCVSSNNQLECTQQRQAYDQEIPSELVSGADLLSTGHEIVCASKQGYFDCWGNPVDGLLDIPDEFKHGVILLASGFNNICAANHHVLKCWGFVWSDDPFQTDQYDLAFINLNEVPDEHQSGSGVDSIRVHKRNVCLSKYTKLQCWGLNYYGVNDIPDDQRVNVSLFSLSSYQVCACTSNGKVNCWGFHNSLSQLNMYISDIILFDISEDVLCQSTIYIFDCLGDGQNEQIPDTLKNQGVDHLSVGLNHVCASKFEYLLCFNYQDSGDQSIFYISAKITQNWSVPTLKQKISIVYHCNQTFCIFKGSLICQSQSVIKEKFILIITPNEMNQINNFKVTFSGSICGINDGKLICWNLFREDAINQEIPNIFNSGTTNFAIGTSHICASTDNLITCWGFNPLGELDIPYSIPGVTLLSSYSSATCASSLVKFYCWGVFLYGQDFQTVSYELNQGVDQVGIGSIHMCILKDNEIKCYGLNQEGLLDIPEQLQINKVDFISVGEVNTCAQYNNKLICWGDISSNNIPKQIENNGIEKMISCTSVKCGLQNAQWVCWGGRGIPQDFNVTEQFTVGDQDKFDLNNRQDICIKYDDSIECKSDIYEQQIQTIDAKVHQSLFCIQINIRGPMICQVDNLMLSRIVCTMKFFDFSDNISQTGDSNIVKISCGTNHVCALFKSGEVHCFGGSLEQDEANLSKEMINGVYDVHAGQNTTCILNSTQIICTGNEIILKRDRQILNNLKGLDEIVKFN